MVLSVTIVKPLSIISGKVPEKWGIYNRLSEADINEDEERIKLFDIMEEVLEWE